MRNRSSWRRVAAVLALSILLASSGGVAQAYSGRMAEPGWFEWIVARAHQVWTLVAGGMQTDGGEEVIGPKG